MSPLRGGGLTVLVVAACMIAGPASSLASTGANFVATGHDMDFHCATGTPEECEYLKIVLDKVRSGSTLPILAIDQGTELPNALSDAGFKGSGEVVTVNPTDTETFNAMAFVDGSDHPLYSAIVTASDSSCGGCDDTPEGETNVNARAGDFATYFNHGGGILALAGADNYSTYYSFVPLTVGATVVSPPFTVTSDGSSLGVTDAMANCCETHNSFTIPPSPLVVLEDDGAGKAEMIAAFGAEIGEGGFTAPPEEKTTTTTTTPTPAAAVLPSKTEVAPKKCTSVRSVTIHWLTAKSGPLSKVLITLNGKIYKRLAGNAGKAKISFGGRSAGAVTVKITGTATAGGKYISTRIFHPCAASAGNSGPVVLFLRHH